MIAVPYRLIAAGLTNTRKYLVAGSAGVMLGAGCSTGPAVRRPSPIAEGTTAPILDRALFVDPPTVSAVRISPDGQFVSFLTTHEGISNLWLHRTNRPFAEARPLTAVIGQPIREHYWSRDGQYLLYLHDERGTGHEHLFAFPMGADPGRVGIASSRNLTPYGSVRARVLDLPRAAPASVVVGLNDRDPAAHDLYRVDLQTGERELVFENRSNIVEWLFDAEGVVRLGVRIDETGGTELIQIENAQRTVVYRCRIDEFCRPLRYHGDGERIFLVSNRGTDVDLTRLILFHPQTRTHEVVDTDPERRVDFGTAVFSERTGELSATVYVDDRARIYPKRPEFARDLERLRTALPPGDLSFESMSGDERRIVIRVSRDVDPGSIYLYDRGSEDATLLLRVQPEVPREHLAVMQPIRYRARDGLQIPAYLTVPPGIAARNLPTVVLPHDGPWARDSWGYDPFVQYLANRGYAVLQPNFRGSSGYGKRFLNRGNRAWGTGGLQRDLTDGVEFLVSQGIADPTRIGIIGTSYGGFAVLAGLAFTPALYRAGVSHAGPPSVPALLQSFSGESNRVKALYRLRVGDPDRPEDRARLMEQSPLHSAGQIEAALLIINGGRDPRVHPEEIDQLVVALRDRGRTVEYLLADDEGHLFVRRENCLSAMAVLERFLSEHLGGRYQRERTSDLAARIQELTVDVSAIKVAFGSFAAALPLPRANGGVLTPETLYYRTRFDAQGQAIEMAIRRTLEPVVSDGREVWRLVDSAQMLVGAVIDTVELDRETLMPVRRTVQSGGVHLDLRHTRDSVLGSIRLAGDEMEIGVQLPAPAFADGAALETVIAALPLGLGYKTPLRIFDAQLRQVRPMTIEVAREEAIRSAAGAFETYVVYVTPTDDNEVGTSTLHVMREQPHHVVLASARLPQAMGGGTSITELTALGGRIRAR